MKKIIKKLISMALQGHIELNDIRWFHHVVYENFILFIEVFYIQYA